MPEDGLREMICNAIIHRDYLGTFIHMRVWADRIQLWNEGTLPQSITIEKLMEDHESMPRNPLIAKVFYMMGFIENWGRGYEKIRDAFEQAHLQVPTFEQVRGGFMATIQREVFQKVQGGQGSAENVLESDQENGKESALNAQKWPEKWPEKAQLIIETISRNKSVSIQQLEEQLTIGHTTIKKILREMQVEGIIRRVGPAKGGHWEIISTK